MPGRSLRPIAAAATALVVALATLTDRPAAAQAGPRIEFADGTTVAVVGNTFAERMAMSGYLSALIHAAHPDRTLSVRQVPWSADEVGTRPREHKVPSMKDNLAEVGADAVIMCFGMSESFAGAAGLPAFREQLGTFIDEMRATSFNGSAPPQLILISPIAHEDLGAPMVTGAALEARNRDLAAYVAAMAEVAGTKGVPFVDLFSDAAGVAGALTSNGIHPNELGCFHYAMAIGTQLGWVGDVLEGGEAPASAETLRRLAWDIHHHERLLYRATNTEYVWGRRHEPYGIVNFPPEMAQLRRMIDARDAAISAMDKPTPEALFAAAPSGAAVWETVPTSQDFPEDVWAPAPVEAKGRENSVGSLTILEPDAFKESFTLPEGYVIDCFASEQTFPELQSPLAMNFDAQGRLWVLCAPTYPHLLPGEQPRCRLVIIEDTNGDGRADTSKTFADKLYIPSGFAIDTDAVYVGQAPDLLKLTDVDGDDVADRREIVASGFGMPDSHHTISAFEWEPNGGLLIHEGVFTKSNVETPYGTRRTRDAAVWRYDTRTKRLDLLSHCGFANPWGHAFDDYGQSVLADASGGANFSFSHVITAFDFPKKPNRVGPFINRGRPTAGCELISSRHFPEDVQDSFLVNQSIGFHGTRWSSMRHEGSGYGAAPMPKDLIDCSDVNFRPVAMEIGPDGAFYVCDWCNPLIGHMQYNVRDPRRDHDHGRIWRVTHAERPLVSPPTIADKAPDLLEQLRIPERNTRQHARRRLQKAAATDVFPEVVKWLAVLDPTDPLHDRMLLETLWLHQAHGRIDLALLERVATLDTPRARAGAIRVLRHWLQQSEVDPAVGLPLLERAVNDADMSVRLEAVTACGFIPSVAAAAVAAAAAEHEMDDGLRIVFEGTLAHLERYGEPDSAIVRRLRLERMPAAELAELPMDDQIAAVMLLRAEVLPETRRAALVHLAGGGSVDQVTLLLETLQSARETDVALTATADLLLAMPAGDLGTAERPLLAALDVPVDAEAFVRRPVARRAVRTLAAAALVLVSHEHAGRLADEPRLLVDVMCLLKPGEVPASMVGDLQHAVEDGRVVPGPAVTQIVRHAGEDLELVEWLAAQVDRVDGWELRTVYREHAAAMAALRAMNGELEPLSDRYAVAALAEDRWAAGHDVYFDEINGCVRCHGVDGRGEEGFPPLDGSPWILGDPERAANIVVHGLYGQIHSNDGRTFDSVMEPLGGLLDDQQIADVLSFVRQSWTNYAPAVTVEQVTAARASESPGVPVYAGDLEKRFPIDETFVLPPLATPVAIEARPVLPASLLWFVCIGILGTLLLGLIIDKVGHGR